jgi:hypothetical protein
MHGDEGEEPGSASAPNQDFLMVELLEVGVDLG